MSEIMHIICYAGIGISVLAIFILMLNAMFGPFDQ